VLGYIFVKSYTVIQGDCNLIGDIKIKLLILGRVATSSMISGTISAKVTKPILQLILQLNDYFISVDIKKNSFFTTKFFKSDPSVW